MSENTETLSVPKVEKTNWKDELSKAIHSAISKNPKRVYPAYDVIFDTINNEQDSDDLYRAIFSKIFFPGPSKIAAEKIARRKFRWDPNQNLDLSQMDHLVSAFLEYLTNYISHNPEHTCRQMYVEHVPEMLAALTTIEREIINIKTMQLIYGRNVRKKKIEQVKSVVVAESTKNDVTHIQEIETPTTVSINEPELKLEPVLEPVIIADPETKSDARLNTKDPFANSPIPDTIVASYAESQRTYTQEGDPSAI